MAMECVAKICTVRNVYDGCFLSCWLCDSHAHVKCAGFNGRHFDIITAKESGLRWTCWKCRDFDVDFYRLFKEAKKGFYSLNSDFVSISAKLKSLEEMFDNFKWPEGTSSSPRRKKPSCDRNLVVPVTPNMDNLDSLFLSPKPSSSVVPLSTQMPSGCPIASKPSTEGNDESVVVNVVPPDSAVNRKGAGPVQQIISSDVLPSSDDGNTINQSSQGFQELIEMGDLIVVPPRRTVFISRLSAETSVDKVKFYIKSHCADFNENDFKVFKFNSSQPRDISSFKVVVPDKSFNTLVNTSFWPQGVLVKEFIFRDRPRRPATVDLHLPKN